MSNPGVAQHVAGELRRQILAGRYHAGDRLPSREQLQYEFHVSPPSLREAFRILEGDGLVTVRRGKSGGSFVRSLSDGHAARTLGMVLQSRKVGIGDIGQALLELEPLCAALCADRDDRAEVVVPHLVEANRALRNSADRREFSETSRAFHELIAELCGNQTFALFAGALESLYSTHVAHWTEQVMAREALPRDDFGSRCIDDHEALIELIASGDREGAYRRLHAHNLESYDYMKGIEPTMLVDAELILPDG